MRVLMVTSFPIPGEYDGTAMLPIKILRALKPRGVDVVRRLSPAQAPDGTAGPVRGFRGDARRSTSPRPAGLAVRDCGGLPASSRSTSSTPSITAARPGLTPPAAAHGWPLVYEIHSLLGDEVERHRLGRGLVFRSYLAVERRVFQHAAQVIVLGEPVKQVVVDGKGRSGRAGVASSIRASIWPSTSGPAARRRSPESAPRHKVIMYIGSIVHPNQGVPILIEALPRIFECRPDARVRPGRRSRRGGRALPRSARAGRRPPDRPGRPDPRPGRRADPAAPMSWSIPGSPAARTTRCRARSRSISPPAARSSRPTSAITSISWDIPARVC